MNIKNKSNKILKKANVVLENGNGGKKKKFPAVKERRIERPTAEQLDILGRAIYHTFKMTFGEDPTNTSLFTLDGKPVLNKAGGQLELNELLEQIVQTYSTL